MLPYSLIENVVELEGVFFKMSINDDAWKEEYETWSVV